MAASDPLSGRTNRPIPSPRDPIVQPMDMAFVKDLIQGLGLNFRWHRAVACPCRLNDQGDNPDPTCVLCNASGWWYVNPDKKHERHSDRGFLPIRCAFSQAGLTVDLFKNGGRWDSGDAVLVAQEECRVGYRDKFVGLDQEMTWTELLIRGTSRDVPIGKSTRTTAAQTEAMRYEPVRVDFVGTADGTRYYEGTDFILTEETLTQPRRLRWKVNQDATQRGPAVGTRYTVFSIVRPVWIVDAATYAVQFTRVAPDKDVGPMPHVFKVRLDYLTEGVGT